MLWRGRWWRCTQSSHETERPCPSSQVRGSISCLVTIHDLGLMCFEAHSCSHLIDNRTQLGSRWTVCGGLNAWRAGRKSRIESFAGANVTYTIEAMMGDRRALQVQTQANLLTTLTNPSV